MNRKKTNYQSKSSFSFFSFLLASGLTLGSPSHAQDEATSRRVQGANEALEAEVIINQVDTSKYPKVSIFTTVLKNGEPASGLTDKDFVVKEDEVEQEPLSVAPKLDPLNAVITIDTSGSIKKALPDVQNAAKMFLDKLAPEDKFQVITFAREVKSLGNLGGKEEAKKAIDATVARGDTALYDAVYSSVDSLKTIAGRKAVILLSDGVDDDGQGKQLSTHSIDQGLKLASELNIPVFTIGLGSAIDEAVLKNVATSTGGKYFNVASPESLQEVYAAIGRQLGGQYGIFYTSNLPADGTQHRIALSHQGKVSIKEYMAPLAQAVSVAQAPQPVSQVSRVSIEAVNSPGLHVAVTIKEGGDLITVRKIEVFKGDGVFEKRTSVESKYDTSRASFKLPSGDYYLVANKGEASVSANVKVKEGEANNIVLNLNAGTINMAAIANEGGPQLSGVKFSANTISDGFAEAKNIDNCYNADKCSLLLNAGQYRVVAGKGLANASKDITIVAGESVNQLLVMNAGVIRIKAVPVEGAPFTQLNSLKIFGNLNAFEGPKELDTCYNSEMCSFTVSAGEYLLRAIKGGAVADKKVTVAPGGAVDQVISLNAGTIVAKVLKGAGGPPVKASKISILKKDADGNLKEVDGEYNSQLYSLTVSAGDYTVKTKKDETELSKDVSVTAGGKVEVEMIY